MSIVVSLSHVRMGIPIPAGVLSGPQRDRGDEMIILSCVIDFLCCLIVLVYYSCLFCY